MVFFCWFYKIYGDEKVEIQYPSEKTWKKYSQSSNYIQNLRMWWMGAHVWSLCRDELIVNQQKNGTSNLIFWWRKNCIKFGLAVFFLVNPDSCVSIPVRYLIVGQDDWCICICIFIVHTTLITSPDYYLHGFYSWTLLMGEQTVTLFEVWEQVRAGSYCLFFFFFA